MNKLLTTSLSILAIAVPHFATAATLSINGLKVGDTIRTTEPLPRYTRGYNLLVVECSNKKNKLGFYLDGPKASVIKKTRKGNVVAKINGVNNYYFSSGTITFRVENPKVGYSAKKVTRKARKMECK